MTEPTPVEMRQIAQQIDELKHASVTRAEFDELKRLVQDLIVKVDQLATRDGIPDEHLAIMSAVFAATIGKRFKIRSVKKVVEPSGWAQAGRVSLHAQRHVRRS